MWRSHIGAQAYGAQSRGSTPPPLGPGYHDAMMKHHGGQFLPSSRASTPGPHEQPTYDLKHQGGQAQPFSRASTPDPREQPYYSFLKHPGGQGLPSSGASTPRGHEQPSYDFLNHQSGQALPSSRASTPDPRASYEQPTYDCCNRGTLYYQQTQPVGSASTGNSVCQGSSYQQFQPVADVEIVPSVPPPPAPHADTVQRKSTAQKQRFREARQRTKKEKHRETTTRVDNDSNHLQKQYAWSRVRTPSPEFWGGSRCSTGFPMMQSLHLPPQVTWVGPTTISLADNVFQTAEQPQALRSMPMSGHGVAVQQRTVMADASTQTKVDAMTQTTDYGDVDTLEASIGGTLANEQSIANSPDAANPAKALIFVGEENECSDYSIGSIGHPHSCKEPCKYRVKPRGCRDGANCDHCHMCRWRPSVDRLLRRLKNQAPQSESAKSERFL